MDLAIKLFSKVSFPSETNQTPKVLVEALNLEVGSLGYTLNAPLIAALSTLSESSFNRVRNDLILTLSEIKGVGRPFTTLFKNFPYSTPNQHLYMLARIVGHYDNLDRYGHNHPKGISLSCGHHIDPDLFDLSQFGACPICQFQVDELQDHDEALFAFMSATKLKTLSYADTKEMKAKAAGLLGRNSSMSPDEANFLRLYASKDMPKPERLFKETMPLAYTIYDDIEYIGSQISGATDVLRIASYVSNPEADLSLKDNTRFRLTTHHKKNILRLLENTKNLEEDLLRNRERWLRVGEKLNPGSAENKRKYPKVAAAFNAIRNYPENIETHSRFVHKRIESGVVDVALINALKDRPGEFMRRLDYLLRTAGDTTLVFDALAEVAPKVPSKMLFTLKKYFEARNEQAGQRAFMPKGKSNKIKLIDDTRAKIDPSILEATGNLIQKAIIARLRTLPPLGKVYVDPNIAGLLVPFNQRGDSSKSSALIKGSRYPMGDAPVLRLFVWWKANTDVDLSMIALGDDRSHRGHVAYTNLSATGIKHSGDIQNAPNGGSEFIDIDIKTMRKNGIRYIMTSVNSYRGEKFSTFPCFAGYMGRDSMTTGKKYEPESVEIKFDLETDATKAIPMIFDLATREVIFADLDVGSDRYGAVAYDSRLTKMVESVLDLPKRKTMIMEVIANNVFARGELVSTPEEADKVFNRETLNIDEIFEMMP